MSKQKLMIVLGTRPEAIKLAPLVLAARARPEFEVVVCNTGQHREMCAQVLGLFGVRADLDLAVMKPRQTLTDITAAVLPALGAVLDAHQPDWLIVQGDTTTTFAAALTGFYHRIKVAHVEAGLRTGNPYSPYPEEMNRLLVSRLAALHFPPLPANADHLYREGVAPEVVAVTGNTGIDALKWLVARFADEPALLAQAQQALDATGLPCLQADAGAPLTLITGHRRESFGPGFLAICQAIAELARRHPERHFVYPLHPNPAVRDTVERELGGGNLTNVHLIAPLDYLPFVRLMARAELILTDSGGVQEEAPSLGKRVAVMRECTERGEGMATGLVRLSGADRQRIVAAAEAAYSGAWPADGSSDVYGDGHACERILARLLAYAGVEGAP